MGIHGVQGYGGVYVGIQIQENPHGAGFLMVFVVMRAHVKTGMWWAVQGLNL